MSPGAGSRTAIARFKAASTERDDGLLTASEVAQLKLGAEWVILSACNTAAPDGTPGAEGLSGLAKAFLYAILVKYKDLEFVDTAKGLLMRSDGSIDGHALAYLRRVLGADAIPIIQTAVNDERITDNVARYALRDAVLFYIGQNAAADQLLLQTVQEGLNKQEEGERFNWGVMKLPTTALFRNLENIPDEAIMARQRLLSQMRQQSIHPEFAGGLDRMENKFNSVLEERRSPQE